MRTALLHLQGRVSRNRCNRAFKLYSQCVLDLYPPRHVATPDRSGCSIHLRELHHTVKRAQELQHQGEAVPFLNFRDRLHGAHGRAAAHAPSNTVRAVIPRLSKDQRKDPETFVALLDRYLPPNLRSSPGLNGEQSREKVIGADRAADCDDILTILNAARRSQYANSDILLYMLLHGYHEAALHIINMLLENLALRYPARPSHLPPSDLLWPAQPLNTLCHGPFDLDMNTSAATTRVDTSNRPADDPRYTLNFSTKRNATMTEIWTVLGSLFIELADLAEGDAWHIVNCGLIIIGRIHNLDLIPENVYSYQPSPFTSTVQRPPILHLVSSRILTALSDAAWRLQQRDMIGKAVEMGISWKEIGRNAPGGRFRLKVRPLGPEIWLEFVLWCCVEGGFHDAGHRIISILQSREKNPWYAITWTPAVGTSRVGPVVDWDRVRLRHGGSVGLIEGYSREKPFVEMPNRTISAEAVLALVNTSIDIAQAQGSYTAIEALQKRILDMITFLEPHDLPPNYLNSLAARLLQSQIMEDATLLQGWYDKLTSMKMLKPAQPHDPPGISMGLESLAVHSELSAGILHHALDGFVHAGDVHRALQAFNALQELVDVSKLQAIGSFLDFGMISQPGFFASQPRVYSHPDFVGSHGQLPLYKLASLLNLATDTGLVGLGQWLIYSDDPDGPLIPPTAYADPAMGRVLLRFSALSQDVHLRSKVLLAQSSSKRRRTIRFTRALVQANFSNLRFSEAWKPLRSLAMAQGGGYGVDVLASLAGMILRIEAGMFVSVHTQARNQQCLDEAGYLLDSLLGGRLDASFASFRRDTRTMYRRHVSALLHLFQHYPDSMIGKISSMHAKKYPLGNVSTLSPRVFNIFMEAVVDAKGSMEGVRIWEEFCGSSRTRAFSDDDIEDASTGEDVEDWSSDARVLKPASPPQASVSFSMNDGEPRQDSEAVHDDSHVIASPPPRQPSGDISFSGQAMLQESQLDVESDLSLRPFAHQLVDVNTVGHTQPITEPDQRTLRVIVRQAIQEKSELNSQTRLDQIQSAVRQGRDLESISRLRNISEPDRVMEWALKQFKRMGVSKHMIETETQERLSDAQFRDLDLSENEPLTSRHRAHYRRITTGRREQSHRHSPAAGQFGGRPMSREYPQAAIAAD